MIPRSKFRFILVALFAVAAWTIWPGAILSHNPTTTTVLFNREIIAVLQNKCLQCHGDGKMAVSLATYADARPWAVAMKEEVLARRMPPWPAEAGYGAFANDIGLTTREMDFLVSWVEGGAPEGEDNPPPFIDHGSHWMLGEPQAIAAARQGVTVPADSPARFTRIVLDTNIDRETWIRAVDFKPGDPRVVRAAFFTVIETDEYLGGWTPWQSGTELPEGVAFRLPARARIAVDVLYRGVGEPVVDTPRLALYVARERPARRASTARTARLGAPARLVSRHAVEAREPTQRPRCISRGDHAVCAAASVAGRRSFVRGDSHPARRIARGSAARAACSFRVAVTVRFPQADFAACGLHAGSNCSLRSGGRRHNQCLVHNGHHQVRGGRCVTDARSRACRIQCSTRAIGRQRHAGVVLPDAP